MVGLSLSVGEICALCCAFLWALNGLVLRSQVGAMSPAAMNAWRCMAGGLPFLMLLPFDRPLATFADVSWQHWALLFGSLVSGPAIGATLYITSLREIGAARAMPLTGTYPLATLLFEYALLGHRATGEVMAGTALVVAGIVLLSRQGSGGSRAGVPGNSRLGALLAIGGALLWGLSTVLLRPALDHFSIVQANAVRMPLVALLLYTFRVRPSGERILRTPVRALVLVGLIGLGSQGIGNFVFLYALQDIGAGRTVALSSTYPVIGLLLAAVFLKEQVTPAVLLGAACCMAGVYLVL
ncbi:DMT family transporter [Candidatus Latescibacterota bacterium]